MQMYYSGDESASNTVSYERSRMQKDMILQMLKKRGCRITKQRMMILDIILEEAVDVIGETKIAVTAFTNIDPDTMEDSFENEINENFINENTIR